MGDFVILTDSSTDLTKDLRERFGVTDYLPGIVVLPDGKKEESTLDWELMSPDEYYGSMTKDAIYTTGIKNIELQEAISSTSLFHLLFPEHTTSVRLLPRS